MRNFPIVPKAQQKAMKEAQILAFNKDTRTELVAYKSSVEDGYKAYEMVKGEYIRWTTQAYPTKEEAIKHLKDMRN